MKNFCFPNAIAFKIIVGLGSNLIIPLSSPILLFALESINNVSISLKSIVNGSLYMLSPTLRLTSFSHINDQL